MGPQRSNGARWSETPWLRVLLLWCLIGAPSSVGPVTEGAEAETGPSGETGGRDALPIGFRMEHAKDPTRPFLPVRDETGDPRAGETARPLQLLIWYPAVRSDGRPVTRGEIVRAWRSELEGFEPPADPATAESEYLRRTSPWPHVADGPSPADLAAHLAAPTAAVRGATPGEGPFPLVLYPFASKFHVPMVEALAGRGFVVVSFPIVGAGMDSFQRSGEGPRDLAEMAADFAFVRAWAHRELPFVDPERTAAAGPSAAGPGLAWVARSLAANAVVAWEANFPESLSAWPWFSPERIRIPILVLGSRRASLRPDWLRGLRHSDRILVRFPDLDHRHTYAMPEILDRAASPAVLAGHEGMVRYMTRFLEWALLGQEEAGRWVRRTPADNGFETTFEHHVWPGSPPDPLPEEWAERLMAEGGARNLLDSVVRDPEGSRAVIPIEEEILSRAMWRLSDHGRSDDAAALARLWPCLHPDSLRAARAGANAARLLERPDLEAGLLREALVRLESVEATEEEKQEVRHRLEDRLDEVVDVAAGTRSEGGSESCL